MSSASILLSSCMISTILASESIQATLRFPEFDGTDIDIFRCDSNTKDGSFTFDAGRGSAYFTSSDSMFYLEYYAPVFYWTGFSSADQSVNDVNHECLECLGRNNRAHQCQKDCVADHIFIVSGQSEDAASWVSLELKITELLQLPNVKHPSEFHDQQIEKVSVCERGISDKCHTYVHVKYYRDYINRNGDKFELFHDENVACFSWIISNPTEGAFVTAVKASTVFKYDVVCADMEQYDACSNAIATPAPAPTDEEKQSILPLPIPATNQFVIPENACKSNDLSLVFVMDLSDSISEHSMDIGKQWISQTMEIAKQLLTQHDLHLRSSLITFSSKTDLIWNVDQADETVIDNKLNNLERPHDVLIEEGLTFTNNALQRVADDILPLKYAEEQMLVVILTDGLPSNEYQSPCYSDSDISTIFHDASVRTVVVAIEQGNTFDTSPFACLYYPYSTEKSFVSIENYQSLLGYQMNPIVIDAAFPIACDVNSDIIVPSNLYTKVHEAESEDISESEGIQHADITDLQHDDESAVSYNKDTCDPTEEYVPIRGFVNADNDKTYTNCDQATTEWRLELVDWLYHEHHDKTEYIYSLCTSHLKPFNHCKAADSDDDLSQNIKSIALQMPCECEICIGYAVHDMKPSGQFAQLEKAWIWSDLNVAPGQCQTLTMTLMGYAEAVNGNYFLEGIDKYESGVMSVPNPCNGDLDHMIYPIPHVPSKDSYPSATKCKDEASMEPYYPSYCKGFCHPKQMEYEITFVEYKYSKGSDKTRFKYSLTTLKPAKLPENFCSYYPFGEAIPLKEFHLSVPCECQHMIQNGETLFSVTDGMMPENDKNGVSEFHWHFTDLNIKVGETKNITIIMNGMIPFGMGDYTVVGDMDRCGYGRHVIRVPDICNNRCLWGQWTQWDTKWESCSKKCGGGITKRSRKCVSVCDGKTPVFNCYGEAEELTPCNTNECGNYKQYPDSITSSAKYWAASSNK